MLIFKTPENFVSQSDHISFGWVNEQFSDQLTLQRSFKNEESLKFLNCLLITGLFVSGS